MYGGGPAPLVLLGAEDFLGVESHVPSNLLTRISGHAPHDGEQSALGHVFSVVDWLAGSNAGEKFVVLGLVDVVVLSAIHPQILALGVDGYSVASLGKTGSTGGSLDLGAHVAFATLHLAGVAVQLGPVVVFIDDGMMVEYVAVFFLRAHMPATHAYGLDWVGPFGPRANIEKVNMLLHVEIAR